MKTSAPPGIRCGYVDCKLPALPGEVLCIEHKPKPLTMKQAIARNPFEVGYGNVGCTACGEMPKGIDGHDVKTGLCRPCWRAWRWSAIREFEYGGKP